MSDCRRLSKTKRCVEEARLHWFFSAGSGPKVLMFKFHYEYMLPKYGVDNARLLFPDRDSLMYHINTADVYADMKMYLDKFDTSDYPPEHSLHSNTNKKVIGKFKDETAREPLNQFVGLRAKMYSFVMDDGKEKKTAKGVKKSVKEREIKHRDFKDCLFNKQHSMMGFRSDCHAIFTEKLMKPTLSPYDNKGFILEDGNSFHLFRLVFIKSVLFI